MPDQINYILRMQEYVENIFSITLISLIYVFIYRNEQYTYHAQSAKIDINDYLWKRSPEDFCQGIYILFCTSIYIFSFQIEVLPLTILVNSLVFNIILIYQ
jgi:hypothetical protein